MKKLILCAAAMLFATMGFSQNESLIDQGKVNTADVNQASTIDMHYNFSDVYQRGENDADIDQIGENSSIVRQNGNTNSATVYQDGGDGLSNAGNAWMQESEVYQQGKNNLADVMQVGEGNQSFIDQLNNEGGGHSIVKIGNKAVIEQTGRHNYSDVDQDNDANWAKTLQYGRWNKSITIQKSDELAAAMHPSGYLQGSDVDQTGKANYSYVYQNGDNQSSIITQSADNFIGSTWTNEAYVTQNGELNLSNINQSDCEMVDANNYAVVNQTNKIGSLGGNISNVLQKGANTAIVTQVNGLLVN